MPHDSAGQAGANQIDETLRKAEKLIGDWDQHGGLTYRQLAERLSAIFGAGARRETAGAKDQLTVEVFDYPKIGQAVEVRAGTVTGTATLLAKFQSETPRRPKRQRSHAMAKPIPDPMAPFDGTATEVVRALSVATTVTEDEFCRAVSQDSKLGRARKPGA